MPASRASLGLYKAHVAALVLITLLVTLLTFTYMMLELAYLRSLVMSLFIVSICLSNLLAGLALRKIGYSPRLGLTGFVMGLVPLILYLALPEKRGASS